MNPNVLMSEDRVSAMVGKSTKTLARWRREGDGPPWVRVGKTPQYVMQDVLVWMLRNRVDPHDQSKPIVD